MEKPRPDAMVNHGGAARNGDDMGTMNMAGHKGAMSGMFGPYAMTREASGTSWQPDSTPIEGIHAMRSDWMMMAHGYVNAVYDHQGGPRGDEQSFAESMLMLMAQRPLGNGTLGLRAMASLDPTIGKRGCSTSKS